METNPRHDAIMEIVRHEGRVKVPALARQFGVSRQTIRKDLEALASRHQILRFHGGAMLPSGVVNVEYETRRAMAAEAKSAIGKAVAKLIPDNASLFINVGTTTEAVGRALRGHRRLMVIADNVHVANQLRVYPELEVLIAGGVVRSSDGAIVGEAAVDFVRQFMVDFAVIGVSAIGEDGALYDYDFREVKVVQAIMEHARHVVLAADSTKFERAAPVRIGTMRQVDVFVTDRCHAGFRAVCHDMGVQVVEALGIDKG